MREEPVVVAVVRALTGLHKLQGLDLGQVPLIVLFIVPLIVPFIVFVENYDSLVRNVVYDSTV